MRAASEAPFSQKHFHFITFPSNFSLSHHCLSAFPSTLGDFRRLGTGGRNAQQCRPFEGRGSGRDRVTGCRRRVRAELPFPVLCPSCGEAFIAIQLCAATQPKFPLETGAVVSIYPSAFQNFSLSRSEPSLQFSPRNTGAVVSLSQSLF